MAQQTWTLNVKRYPVPLRRTVAKEEAMLNELEAVRETYGGMNEKLRGWLRRGLEELKQRTKQVSAAGGDAIAALDAVATIVSSSVAVNQHFLEMYDEAQKRASVTPVAGGRQLPPRAVPLPASQSSPTAVEPPTAAPAASAELEQASVEQALRVPAETPPEAVSQASKKTHNWSHLKGLAGVDKPSGRG